MLLKQKKETMGKWNEMDEQEAQNGLSSVMNLLLIKWVEEEEEAAIYTPGQR